MNERRPFMGGKVSLCLRVMAGFWQSFEQFRGVVIVSLHAYVLRSRCLHRSCAPYSRSEAAISYLGGQSQISMHSGVAQLPGSVIIPCPYVLCEQDRQDWTASLLRTWNCFADYVRNGRRG